MTTILHISDTHFGTELNGPMTALLALHEQLKPELVILSGDITQRARRGQFRTAREFMERLSPRQSLIVPGNHDVPLFNVFERAFYPFRKYREIMSEELEPDYESPELLVIGANTTCPARLQAGEISDEQIARVQKRLERASPGQLRCVVTHHPMYIVTLTDRKNLLKNAERAIHCWAEAGVDLLISGHIHLPYVRNMNGRYPEIERPLWAVQAGTATSERVRGEIPNSINVVRYVNRADCLVERWDYSAPDNAFLEFSSVEVELAQG